MHVMTGIPDSKIDQVLEDLALDGSRLVSKQRNAGDNTWTIVIEKGPPPTLDELAQFKAESEDPPGSGDDQMQVSQDSNASADFIDHVDGDALILTEADLIALWRRSSFPIPGNTPIVFGIRGCLPVDYGGTSTAKAHQISLTPVNYRTMNCSLGIWFPGGGFSLYPGSTVPYGPWVTSGVAEGGRGVNQIGRGRYRKYVPGWHKRSEGKNGHWALLQECPITIQRTADDNDFDLADRWESGRIAGDNIHCAFNMGPDAAIPSAKYSSLGCQVIAGTVKKGSQGTESGPWKKFIGNFPLGSTSPVEYVLFDGLEVQQMIRNRCEGKSIVLRMGSVGPHVLTLKQKLSANNGLSLGSNDEFDVATFQAVIDFQSTTFGTNSDDGIVGTETAEKLGFSLPVFDYRDAVGGGKGYVDNRDVAAESTELARAIGAANIAPGTRTFLSVEEFSKFASPPSGSTKTYDKYINAFVSKRGKEILGDYGIPEKPIRVAHFFGQAAHETGGFRLLRESLTYTTVTAVRNAWHSRALPYTDQWITDHLLRNPEALGDWAYGNRMGNDRPGDGNKYRGGGVFQLTGKEAYRKLSELLKPLGSYDLENDPSLIEDPYISLIAACVEWKNMDGNSLADANDGRRISRGINRGDPNSRNAAIGEEERLEITRQIRGILEERA